MHRITITGALLAVTLSGCAVGSSLNEDDKSYGAEDTCKDAVKNSLKSPGTAKFSGMSTSPMGTDEWDTTGEVDSENGFGALLRSSFSCHTTLDSGTFHSKVTDFNEGG